MGLRFGFLLLALLLAARLADGQQYNSPAQVNAPGAGPAIDERSSLSSVHTLTWTTTGNPASCTIAIESAATATPADWARIGSAQDCTHSGTFAVSGVSSNFIRINLSAFAPTSESITYSYTGMGSIGSAQFASASLWAKLDALRAVEALRHGVSTIHHCPLFVPGPIAGGVPYPTDQEFELYHEPFGSDFNVAASFGDTGANGIPSAQNGIQPEALAQVRFESEHYLYDWDKCISSRPTFSFGGTVGMVPAVVLENLTSTTETIANPNNRPMFQDAFGWSLTPKMNMVTSHTSQLSFFATLGENYLVSQVTSFKQGDNTVTATPISNNVGQSAVFWESGVEWKLLNTDIVNAYINKTDVLNPPFEIAAGYRNDSRFKHSGALATFTNPESYGFLRFTVGLNKIINWNSTSVEPGKGYTFKFGVDYERRLGGSNLPTSTRYYVSANFDLVNVFKPTTQPAATGPQQAPQQQAPPSPPAPHAVPIS